MNVGVLALQGAFAEHSVALKKLGAESFEIKQAKDFERDLDGLIIPGGESTVMSKLLYDLDMFRPLEEKIRSGLPVFGTCAGLILLAKKVEGGKPCLATMDITAKRNAYGRQLGSFRTQGEFKGIGNIPFTFIRAPYVSAVGEKVEVLAEVGGKVVAAKQNNQLVTAFHPELNDDLSVHAYFLKMIENSK